MTFILWRSRGSLLAGLLAAWACWGVAAAWLGLEHAAANDANSIAGWDPPRVLGHPLYFESRSLGEFSATQLRPACDEALPQAQCGRCQLLCYLTSWLETWP
jgi:hypothetical protein